MGSPNLTPYDNTQVWIFATRKGAYAAVIGITAKEGREGVLGEMLEGGMINQDAFCSGGDKFENLATEPPDAPLPVFGEVTIQEAALPEPPPVTLAPPTPGYRYVSAEEIIAAQPIQEMSLKDMILQVQRLKAVYYDYSVMMGVGSVGNTVGTDMVAPFLCANIGRFLGLTDHLGEGASFTYLRAGDEPEAFRVQSELLDVWIYQAERVLAMDGRQMTGYWNLECVGNYNIPDSAYIESDTPRAGIVADGDRLTVLGDIDLGFFDRFRLALDQHPEVKTVSLGSGGGSVYDALRSGQMIRDRGLNTALFGKCFSACPMVFVGGVERVIWAGGDTLGFHQIYTDDGPLPMTHDIYLVLRQYLVEMGVDADVFIGFMATSGPSEMFEPDVADLCAPKITTWVQRQC